MHGGDWSELNHTVKIGFTSMTYNRVTKRNKIRLRRLHYA